MKSFKILILLLVIYTGNIKSQNCTFQNFSAGEYYDFSSLSNETFIYETIDNTYVISICNISKYCTDNFINSSVCQVDSNGKWKNLGDIYDFQVTKLEHRIGGTIIYKSISKECPNEISTTVVNMYCSNSQTYIKSVTQDDECKFTVNLYSSLACPILSKTINYDSLVKIKSPSNSVTKSFTINDTSITETVTSRYNGDSDLISITKTTTSSNIEVTNITTTTTIFENGDIKIISTTTSIQGTLVTTDTFDSSKGQDIVKKYFSIEKLFDTNDSISFKNSSYIFILSIFILFF